MSTSLHTVLKRLEIQGFKSFAGKTVLEFPSRVTAVVGPNGSGKSNVIDALRWVLGEREVKNLRGATLDNLIFAGTPKRPAVGFAKVGLWFDNREKLFEEEGSEVVVARRIDRSGASEFSVNDSDVLLRDLVPMLARARLGSRGLTMIGQGQSDLFVKSSPQERREMIEEVLGLREYRLKKTQAERRLETSAVNMEKVQAMLDELAPHLRLLRRQKHRWDKRADVESELTDLEKRFFAFRYHVLETALTEVSGPLEALTKDRTAKEHVVRELDGKVRAINTEAGSAEASAKIRADLATLLDRRGELERSLARLEAKIEFEASKPAAGADHTLAESLELSRGTLSSLKSALALGTLDEVRSALQFSITKIEKFLAADRPSTDQSLTAEVAKLKSELAVLEEGVKRLRAEEESEAKKREELQRAFRDEIERMEKEKDALRRLDREIQEKLLEKERHEIRRNEVVHEWHTLGHTEVELKALPAVTEPLDVAEAERRIMRLRGELIAIGEIDQQVVKEAEESETRFEFLSKELDDLTNAVADLRKLVKELEGKIHEDFKRAFKSINDEFNNYFRLMFGGGKARLKLVIPKPRMTEEAATAAAAGPGEEGKPAEPAPVAVEEEPVDPELSAGVEVDLSLPRKRITSLEMLSGGEKSLVSIAALFALIAVSPPPFLVLDEVDAPLDEENARRFAELVKNFSSKTQFIIVTHNRATMEAADVLYGVTMGDDGVSKVLSLKLD